VAWRQPLHPFLKLSVDPVGLGQTWRISVWPVGRRVVELWHDAISGTFGDETIVTGDIRRVRRAADGPGLWSPLSAFGVNLMGEHGVTPATVRMKPESPVARIRRRGTGRSGSREPRSIGEWLRASASVQPPVWVGRN
jgi:hypothetical protein